MNNANRSYRVRTDVGNADGVLNIDVPLVQTYDTFEILSLKLNQKNQYKYYDSTYGVVVGRVLANESFGIPNAKVSIFIPVESDSDINERILYNFASTRDTNFDGVRYNLLPDYVDNECHQDVGTFPNKRLVLDNDDVIEIFDKYYKYTTTTNQSGDYMLFGVPTGSQTLHVDVDLSDIGVLSQRPRDMIYKGYNETQFDSPNKFKTSTNLNSLAQLYSQDKGIYCYPYWGNSNNDNENGERHIAITRCDIQIDYKFEPTAIFIGSIITDKGSNAIGKNCTGTDTLGKMSDLATGEGRIEMIRKTIDNKVEQFQIKGDRLIDGDGVWCYQIPMNLDYVKTDEFGNTVPTDDPSKGIPTRSRVRFRISIDDGSFDDVAAHKRCRFLVPNNPRYDIDRFPEFVETKEADYEFGSATRDESYCDLFWNNVYTVKSYIPRLQKNKNITNRKHTGIKLINHYGDNNPMPYNNLNIKLSFTFRMICILVKVLVWIIATINQVLALLMTPICLIAEAFLSIGRAIKRIPLIGSVLARPFLWLGELFEKIIVPGITLNSEFCDDGINKIAFYPVFTTAGIECVIAKIRRDHSKVYENTTNLEEVEDWKPLNVTNMTNNEFITCVENQLAQANDATSFLFQNDWVNGVLYAPLWYRYIRKKKSYFFGLFKSRAKDQWCRSDGMYNLLVFQPCALPKNTNNTYDNPDKVGVKTDNVSGIKRDCGTRCHHEIGNQLVRNGLILTKETMLGETVYYYKAIEYNRLLGQNHDNDGVILLFATDIVLLGGLNDCDSNGIPQFFKRLDSTTYKMPTDILFVDTTVAVTAEGKPLIEADGSINMERHTEATGADWGNLNDFDECGKMGNDSDGGLFYGIGCSTIELEPKSCMNLSRVCEYGVSLDMLKEIVDTSNSSSTDATTEMLIPDGYISYDEIYDVDGRSMFATLNGNKLRTKLNINNGLQEYDLRYLYIDNFDGLSKQFMRTSCFNNSNCNYTRNYNLETFSRDYYMFRMGTDPYYYDGNIDKVFPRYENSFYFYFGLKQGKTAIDKFNSQFFASCEDINSVSSAMRANSAPNDWCAELELSDEYPLPQENKEGYGYLKLDLTNIPLPCDIILRKIDGIAYEDEIENVEYEKIYLGYIASYDSTDNIDGVNEFDDYYETNETGYKQKKDWKDIVLYNGEYEVVITDAENNIVTYTFVMSPETLMFNYNAYDNEIPNNQRLEENTTYASLLGKIQGDYVNYGSYIVITYLENGENSDGEYKCEIEINNADIKLKDFDNKFSDSSRNNGGECTFKIENGNWTLTSQSNGVSKVYCDVINNQLYIFVPKGDVDYVITITELCNGVDGSGNFSTATVRINDTMPFKLYVNDVDVAALANLKGAWKTGWKENGVLDGGITTAVNSNWLHLSNENNYDFTVLEEYERAKEDVDFLLQDLRNIESDKLDEAIMNYFGVEANDPIIATVKGLIGKELTDAQYELFPQLKKVKTDFIKAVKETFWLNCSESPKDIVIKVSTRKKPISYYLYYNQEIMDDSKEVHKYKNKLVDGNPYVNDPENLIYYVDAIRIPTITNADDLDYGYGYLKSDSYSNGKISFGHDNSIGHGKDDKGRYQNIPTYFKKPYIVRGENSIGGSLPTIGNLQWNGKEWFMFHIIDKRLKANIIAWSYVNNIPYPITGTDTSLYGEYIVMKGLVCGDIFNGIPEKEPAADGDTVFKEQKVGSMDIKIKTYEGDEDAMPTIRRFYMEDSDVIYNNYGPDGQSVVPPTPYVLIGNSELALEIQSENCQFSEPVKGNMSVSINKNYIDGNDFIFEFKITNGDNYDDNTLYVIDNDKKAYPLLQVSKSGDIYKMKPNYTVMEDNVTTTMLKAEEKEDGTPYQCHYQSFTGSITNNENGEIEDTPSGYGKDNIFIHNGRPDKLFYVVAETSNRCRTLSPLYRYPLIRMILSLSDLTIHTKVYDDVTGLETGEFIETKGYGIKMGIFNMDVLEDCYYLKYYEYELTIELVFDDGSEVKLTTKCKPGTNPYICVIDELTYKKLKPYFLINFNDLVDKNKGILKIKIKDCTNLTLEEFVFINGGLTDDSTIVEPD